MIAMLLLKYLKEKAQYDWHLSNLVTFIRLNLFVKIDRAGDPVDEMAEQSVLQACQNVQKWTIKYRLWIKGGLDLANRLKKARKPQIFYFLDCQKRFGHM